MILVEFVRICKGGPLGFGWIQSKNARGTLRISMEFIRICKGGPLGFEWVQ